jgi:riboflavin synthase
MFTGIIQTIGKITAIDKHASDLSLRIETDADFLTDVQLGDSIACNGVCLTVVKLNGNSFYADVSGESIAKTTIGLWQQNASLNLEKALTPQQRLGGHIVSGHVDDVGELISRNSDGRSEQFIFRAPDNLAKYIASKGSITIDGTSLTVNSVKGVEFSVNIVPHTLEHTVMGDYQVGTKVNLEVDLIARYLERLLEARER